MPTPLLRSEDEIRFYDELPMVGRCAVAGCEGWTAEGPAADVRAKQAAHRASAHPELVNRRRPATATARLKAAAAAETRREQIATRAAEPDPEPREDPDVTPKNTRQPKWTEELAVAAFDRFVAEHGHPPSNSEVAKTPWLPSGPTITKLFGNLGNVHVRLGFDRPTNANRRPAAAPSPPTMRVAPTIIAPPDSPVPGSLLRIDVGTWDGAETVVATWTRGSQPIAGAHTAEYEIRDGDVGRMIGAQVVASNQAGFSDTYRPEPVVVVAPAAEEREQGYGFFYADGESRIYQMPSDGVREAALAVLAALAHLIDVIAPA